MSFWSKENIDQYVIAYLEYKYHQNMLLDAYFSRDYK